MLGIRGFGLDVGEGDVTYSCRALLRQVRARISSSIAGK